MIIVNLCEKNTCQSIKVASVASFCAEKPARSSSEDVQKLAKAHQAWLVRAVSLVEVETFFLLLCYVSHLRAQKHLRLSFARSAESEEEKKFFSFWPCVEKFSVPGQDKGLQIWVELDEPKGQRNLKIEEKSSVRVEIEIHRPTFAGD